MICTKIANKTLMKASISMLHRNFYNCSVLTVRKVHNNNKNIDNYKDKLSESQKLLSKRYKIFDDKDTEIIYDDLDDLDVVLNRKQKKNKFNRLNTETAYLRGKNGVFDIEEIFTLLQDENFKDIVTIKVPDELKYCNYMVICTAISFRHIMIFLEKFNKIYKIKKNESDPFLKLNDTSNDWRLVDMGNIILHVMLQESREFYDIESLWTIGEEYDDKVQRSQYNIVEDIMSKHIDFIEKQSKNYVISLYVIYISYLINAQNIRPNFVILMADDLGYGDVSILGNDTLPTPNIDRIGHEGITLKHHLTAASVCTPSRSAFLTGRYPIRNGMTSPGRNRVFFFVASSGGLPTNETTFSMSLKSLNYSTALIGKWHLGKDCQQIGDNCHHPNNYGFDYFFGIPLTNLKDFGDDGESVILSYYPNFYLYLATFAFSGVFISIILYINRWTKLSIIVVVLFALTPIILVAFQKNIKTLNSVLYRNDKLIQHPIQLKGMTDVLVDEASDFIRNQTEQNRPFLVIVNFIKVHTAHAPSDAFYGKSMYGKYGDCVLELDHGVGRILQLLEELNLKNDTLVYFSSDNGGHLEEVDADGHPEGGSNGIFRGGKGHGAMEGGIRVPSFVMWPNVFPSNLVVEVPTMQMDIFATIHTITNHDLPRGVLIDGKDIYPILKGQSSTSPHRFMFHYCGTYLHGVRYIEDNDHVWKVYFYTPKYKPNEQKCDFVCMCYGKYVIQHEPPLIYNIAQDPSEVRALNSNSSVYENLLQIVIDSVESHTNSIESVPSQFTFAKTVWKPWLQPIL